LKELNVDCSDQDKYQHHNHRYYPLVDHPSLSLKITKEQDSAVTIKQFPQPLVSIIFIWRQVGFCWIDLFNYVVQSIHSSTVGVNQQSRVVHLITVNIV